MQCLCVFKRAYCEGDVLNVTFLQKYYLISKGKQSNLFLVERHIIWGKKYLNILNASELNLSAVVCLILPETGKIRREKICHKK